MQQQEVQEDQAAHQVNVHAHVIDRRAQEVGGRAVELFVLLATFTSPEVLVRRHRHVDVRVESPREGKIATLNGKVKKALEC